jgi:hypothetical protein
MPHRRLPRVAGGNLLMPLLALAALAGFSALNAIDAALYRRLIALWSFNMTLHPFIDAEYVAAEIACFRHGIDVYTMCPADPLQRPWDYSPLWLRFGFLAIGPAWVQPAALLQDAVFAVSLGLIPGTVGWGRWLMAAAMLSPTVIFALERSNVDLTMMALCLGGVALLQGRLSWRVAGYAGFLVAGLLKFYPLVLMGLALSERPRRLCGLAAVSGAIVAAFILGYRHELTRALGNVRVPISFGDGFAATQFGGGLAFLAHAPWLAAPLTLVFCAAALVSAARLAMRPGFAGAFSSLGESYRVFLVAGALLFCGCFLSKPSIGYRGIILLPALPGILAMARADGSRLLAAGAAATVLAMWNFVPMVLFGPGGALGAVLGPLPFLAVWAVRELLWWFVFVILLAVLQRFAMGSAVWRAFAIQPRRA